MTTQTLDRVEIFAVGEWNGMAFTAEDLDEMVRGFEAEQQSGRLPVKLGHTAPDTDPARGWLSRVWREGDRLLARVEQVPQEIVDGIRSGAWRHVSVELLHEVHTAAGRSYRWLLDGLALLGSAKPAVGVLQPLHDSVAGMTFAERWGFSYAPADDAAALRRENARLRAANHRQMMDSIIEGDVRSRVVMAAAREQFRRLFRLTDDDTSYARVQPNDWHSFRATQPRPPATGPASFNASVSGAAPDTTLVARTRQYMADNALRHLQLTGERLTFDRAAAVVVQDLARTEPDLLRAYADMPGVED